MRPMQQRRFRCPCESVHVKEGACQGRPVPSRPSRGVACLLLGDSRARLSLPRFQQRGVAFLLLGHQPACHFPEV
jgi:hypothetical protein